MTETELRERLKGAPRMYTYWIHYKGTLYVVLRSALIERDLSPCVIYARAASAQEQDSQLPPVPFIRPLCEWAELVEHEGKMVPRFRPLDPPQLEDANDLLPVSGQASHP